MRRLVFGLAIAAGVLITVLSGGDALGLAGDDIDAGPYLSPARGYAPLVVEFGANLLIVIDGTYEWHFGDGETSTDMFTSHTYSQPGTYTVVAILNGSILWVGHVEVLGQEHAPGMFFVTDYGATGDGVTDDTTAFKEAIRAASNNGGGAVLVPSVAGGKGYVLTDTIEIPPGVSLIGSLAGLADNGWAAYLLPESHVVGPKILARPAALHKPLFQLGGGVTVRGLWILYDQQTWPSDEEFTAPLTGGGFGYNTFEEAREKFLAGNHVKQYGPTFYLEWGDNTCIEDITADRYYDFFYLKDGAKVTVNNISVYGYGRAFVIEQSADVNFLTNIRIAPNGGPTSPGVRLCKTEDCAEARTYTWIYGLIASWRGNIGLQVGYSDGFDFRGLYFFAVHTGFQLGASRDWPICDPVAGTLFDSPDMGQGPWGSMTDIGIDACAVGLQFVWPGGVAMRISNLLIYPYFDDSQVFTAKTGTGNMSGVGREAAMVFEKTYTPENVYGHLPAVLISNAEIATYPAPEPPAPPGPFSTAWGSIPAANGRVFLVAGGASVDISNLVLNLVVDDPDPFLIAAAASADDVSIRVRGYSMKGDPGADFTLTSSGLER